tara:strand:+ start:91 stop:207 length:117 start_codon:yes stop_codon:yes gene_type:complete
VVEDEQESRTDAEKKELEEGANQGVNQGVKKGINLNVK